MVNMQQIIFINYSISETSGLRSLLITSVSILLHRAAYGLRATACCLANSLPSAAAFSKSSLASSFWHINLRKRPLCTNAWQTVRPVLPLRVIALSRSCRAPGKRCTYVWRADLPCIVLYKLLGYSLKSVYCIFYYEHSCWICCIIPKTGMIWSVLVLNLKLTKTLLADVFL